MSVISWNIGYMMLQLIGWLSLAICSCCVHATYEQCRSMSWVIRTSEQGPEFKDKTKCQKVGLKPHSECGWKLRTRGKIWGRRGLRRCQIIRETCTRCTRNRVVDIFCRLSTMHERDRETDRQTTEQTVTSIVMGEIACHRCRLGHVVMLTL